MAKYSVHGGSRKDFRGSVRPLDIYILIAELWDPHPVSQSCILSIDQRILSYQCEFFKMHFLGGSAIAYCGAEPLGMKSSWSIAPEISPGSVHPSSCR